MCYYKFGDNMAVIYSYHDKDIDMHYSYDEKPNPSQFLMHTHEFYELLYFESGKGVYRVEGTPYTLQKGDIIIVRPAEAHYIDISESKPYSRISIAFNPKVFAEVDPSHKLLVPFDNRKIGTYNCYHADNFKSDIYNLYIKNIISGDSNLRLRILTNLLPLLNEIYEAFDDITATEINKTLDSRIINYINRHISESITLDDICDRFYISKTHLCRIFKRATASTVGEYITVKRLVMARQLILSGNPPTKVYLQCGFKDYSVFYRAYKKKYGDSPSRLS